MWLRRKPARPAAAHNWHMPCEPPAVGSLPSIADYTRPGLIVPSLRETDPAGIIEELSHCLRVHGVLDDVLSFYHTVLNQEFLSNSATSAGIALPHARSPQVRQLTLAIGRAEQPVVWGLRASWSVKYVFLLAVPSTDALNYLSLLSSLARLGRQPEMLDRLRLAAGTQDIFELLQEIRVRPG